MNNSLLPPGSSALERRLAQACSGISDLNVPLRDLWNPWKCPAKFLPYLAWAFSVDRWDERWSESEKRQAVMDAFYVHQHKGTVAAVRRVVEGMGYSMTLSEWWEVADPAGTFRLTVDVNDIGITESLLNELDRLISDAKPVSRHISKFSLSTRTAGIAHIGSALVSADIVTVYPEDFTPELSLRYNGIIHYDGNQQFSGD
ncbi:TPA: phage tail protein I [Klebsiella pneumoniae]|uniref:phage tail protein I n=1 Tax=Klebsiella quasipneumoniae TaxID=1463165 RepID=UPI0039BA3842|nr:phage tail protein I [Klebsiella pneumoniae]HBV3505645.1 phage tail protein I [Klebsiella pneumoniae]